MDAEILVGKVVRVLDGDMLQIMNVDGKPTTVRFGGIDAPEKTQRFGEESTAWLMLSTLNKEVRIEVTDTDRYGRSIGDVYIGSRWLNLEAVALGLAWHYVDYLDDVRLASAQNDARRNNLGLWVDARKVAPWDYRNGQRVETAVPMNVESTRETDTVVYITDTGEKYHKKTCRTCKDSCIPIPLSRAKSAYGPCGICRPPTK